MKHTISLIVAIANNNVIGKDNNLIWKLPADMAFFKEKTSGHCIITGRKNFESIPKKFRPLPNRTNIILSRENYLYPDTITARSIEEAILYAKSLNEKEIFVIGGSEIYKQFLPFADKLYITNIFHDFEGDTFFPELNFFEWYEESCVEGIVDDKNIYPHEFTILERIR